MHSLHTQHIFLRSRIQVDPSLKKADWTPEEDKRIVAAQSRIGSRFAQIAKFLEGRSARRPVCWCLCMNKSAFVYSQAKARCVRA